MGAYVDSKRGQLIEAPAFFEVNKRVRAPATLKAEAALDNAVEKALAVDYRTPEMLFKSGQQTVFSFKLFARKCNSRNSESNRNQSDYWIVDAGNNSIMKRQTSSKATISGSCSIVEYRSDEDDTQIKVFFKNMSSGRTFKNRYFR